MFGSRMSKDKEVDKLDRQVCWTSEKLMCYAM